MRGTTPVCAVLFLSFLGAFASAGEGDATAAPSVPLTESDAADEAVRLAAAKDEPGLARLVSAPQLDPWLVADELCARGAFDAADLYARAATPPKAGGVVAFVESQRRDPTPRPLRDALAAVRAAREAGRNEESLRIAVAAGAPDLPRRDVVSLRLLSEHGFVLGRLGDPRAASAALLALIEPAKAMDWPERVAAATEQAAYFTKVARDLDASAGLWERAAELRHRLAAPAAEGNALWTLAGIRFDQGRLGDALSSMRRAVPLLGQASDATTSGRALSALAIYEDAAGELAPAMAHHEEALRLLEGCPSPKVRVLAAMNASRTCFMLGDVAGAVAYTDRALTDAAATTAPPDPALTVIRGQVLLNRAQYRTKLNDFDAALADVEAAARTFAAVGDRPMSARAAGQRGAVQLKRGDLAGAKKAYDESLALAEAAGDRSLLGLIRLSVGDVADRRHADDEAREAWEAAILDGRASGSAYVESEALRRVAKALLATGAALEALERARESVALERRRAHRLGADEAAAIGADTDVRSSLDTGLLAARRVGDLAAWFEIFESGRASALAESVGGRAAIQAATVSDALTAESDAATAALARAVDETAKARAAGDLAATRAAAVTEAAARERVRVVQNAIERGRKNAARLEAPAPLLLDDVRGRLGKGRALVLFHVDPETAEALVVTADGARLVDLGETKTFLARCDAASAGDASADAVAAAKAALVDALALPKDVRTLLVVPDGPVATVPIALLAPDRDTAIVPSVLVWTLLDAERSERGTGVLAVGDPDYAGTRFVALPATRAEAEAVGTTTLVGKDATEEALRRALVSSPRWHALHFACHGFVDPRRASLSGLALTRAGQDDGAFTAREVLGLPVPADVVVLSACEAGRSGAQSAATGIPPAFLAAGALRVVANLWKVDDEAARVFSVAFHKSWAKEGTTAAQALRAARDAVRADPRFAAPRHWAGWVLWGLPD